MPATASIAPRRIWPLLSDLFLASLVLCVASGLVLAVQYRPLGDVARNVEEITTLAPYGFFFRRLHYFAGQACALLALAHVMHYLAAGAARRVALGPWVRLVGGMAACFGLLLTGFMLKGDLEARHAAAVLENLAGAVPLVGNVAARLLVGRGEGIFFLPYVHHCLVLPPVLYLCLRGHVRGWVPGWRRLAAAATALALWCLVVPLPLQARPGTDVGPAMGPWFLLGLQEMLRHAPIILAGVVLPAVFMGLVAVLPLLRGRAAGPARFLILGGFCLYAVLGFRLVFR